jgi:hypothetical protein
LGRKSEWVQRVTESFIDRAVRTSTQADDWIEQEEKQPQEDLETPAFIRKRLNNW